MLVDVGREIRGLRLRKGWSGARLARLSGVSQQFLSEVERGRKIPGLVVLDAIATALGVAAADLLRGENNRLD